MMRGQSQDEKGEGIWFYGLQISEHIRITWRLKERRGLVPTPDS